MSEMTFRTPRWPDRKLIDILQVVAKEVPVVDAKLYFVPFTGASPVIVSFDEAISHLSLTPVLEFNEAVIDRFALISGGHHFLTVNREGDSLFDKVTFNWNNNRTAISETDYTRLIAIAKQRLKEVKINEAFSGFPNDEISNYYEARDATLTRLEAINSELLFGIHQRQRSLDEQHDLRVKALESKLESERTILIKEFEEKKQALSDQEGLFKAKESEFETRESKYLRRQLRHDMLKRLADLSQKFQLTRGTRRLRLPIMVITGFLILFFGLLTVLAFSQTVQLLDAAGQELTKINWWVLGLLTFKQLAFASAFIAGTWFLIKWNDRWFRQHADAEFHYKQLELDINRASWVVEMALEWKDEKNKEIPPELLDRLTKNLFIGISRDETNSDAPVDIASTLLGSAAKVKFKTGNGAEVELDRKGIKNAMNEV